MAAKTGRKRQPIPPRYTSAAHELLRRAHVAGILPQSETAKKLGISQQFLSGLIRGRRKPGAALQTRIAAAPLEIDERFWSLPSALVSDELDDEPRAVSTPSRLAQPHGPARTKRAYTAPHTPAPTTPIVAELSPFKMPEQEPLPAIDWSSPGSSLGELQTLAERQRAASHAATDPMMGVDARDRNRLDADYRRTLETLAKLTHELGPVDESKLARTATFLRHLDTLTDALRPFPEARRAVIDALGIPDA